jgi:hypothetical protein
MRTGRGGGAKHTGGQRLPDERTRGCSTLLVDELDAGHTGLSPGGVPTLWQARRTDTSVVLADAGREADGVLRFTET